MYREEQTKYLRSSAVMGFMDEIVGQFVEHLPPDPSKFLCEYLMKKHHVSAAAAANASDAPQPLPDEYIATCLDCASQDRPFPPCPAELQENATVKKALVAATKILESHVTKLQDSGRKISSIIKKGTSEALFDAAQMTLRPGMDIENVITGVMMAAKKLLNAEGCAVFIADEKRRVLRGSIGGKSFKMLYGQGIAGAVARSGCALLIPKAYEDPRFNPNVDLELGHVTRDILCLPIQHEEKLVAVVQLVNKIGGCFSHDDEVLFAAFADFIGVGLKNAILFNDQQRLSHRNRRLVAAVESIANTALKEELLIPAIVKDAKQLVGADRCAFFLVDEDRGVIIAHLEGVEKQMELPITAGVVGWCASHRCLLNLPDAYADSRFNPEVDLASGYKTRNILCIPIFVGNKIVAVSELVNKMDSAGEFACFGEEDEEILSQFASVAGVCIRNCRLLVDVEKKKSLVETSLDTARAVCQTDVTNIQGVCDVASEAVIRVTGAERCILFVLDNDYKKFSAPDPDRTGGFIQVDYSGSFIGNAAKAKKTVRRANFAPSEARFFGSQFVVREVVAVPVLCDGECVGVIAAANKPTGKFVEEDAEAIELFAMFVSVAIRNSKLFVAARQQHDDLERLMDFERALTEEHFGSDEAHNISSDSGRVSPGLVVKEPSALLPTYSKSAYETFSDAEINIVLTHAPQPEQLNLLASPKFNIHLYKDGLLDVAELLPLGTRMFNELNLITEFRLDRECLAKFLLIVRSKYRSVPYHNFFHAFDVAQTVFTFIQVAKLSEILHPADLLSAMIAAFCHDIDHMGLNNAFHMKAETPMGILTSLTGNKSVLEVHHCQLTIEILQLTGLIEKIPAVQKTVLFKNIVDMIMATDMASHKNFVAQFESELLPYMNSIAAGTIAPCRETTPPAIRRLLLILLLKMADISNITKDFDVSRKWGICVMEEFYMQGDMERQSGLDVTPMFDREKKVELAKGQTGFINFLGKPFFAVGARCLPGLSYLTAGIEANLKIWDRLLNQTSV